MLLVVQCDDNIVVVHVHAPRIRSQAFMYRVKREERD